ncbi:hypothetical protein AVEN_275587-1 [Araneus ventricosus]|uniref:Uncharacterized protein n=1 Tax=Araneus ventricosus TaxID=182803 RepID=A0A4Y2KBQ3_ARAVE|nr:hypothetical protein AVEN_275587-1 [Araneus ventricosus]
MTSKRALWKAFISLVLIETIIQQADGRPNSTNTIPPSIRLSSKGDVERHSSQDARLPYENASSLKRELIHPFSKSLDTADRPALSFHELPHTKINGHRYSKRRHLNRRIPQPQVGSASSIRYSVLQPFPLPTFSHTTNHGYHRNDRRQDIREYTPHAFRQNYSSSPVSRNEEQPPFIYINLQTVQNQNLPDSQLKSGNGHVYDQPQNQHIQALQRSVVMRDAPGSEARPNYNKKPLLTETPQHLQQGTVDAATPLQYYTASRPSSANLSNLNYNVQRRRIAENQRQIHDVQSLIRGTTENKQDDERNQHNRYFKIIISPEDLKNIEKYSLDPQKLYETKPEEPNVTENQAQTFQQPKIDSNTLPVSQTQQRMTFPSHFNVMQSQKMIAIHEPHEMMMTREPQKVIMQQPNEMMTIREPQKMMMQQPSEMRKREMEELQQMGKETQIPKAVIFFEMGLLRKTTKIPRQEAAVSRKTKEMERRVKAKYE